MSKSAAGKCSHQDQTVRKHKRTSEPDIVRQQRRRASEAGL